MKNQNKVTTNYTKQLSRKDANYLLLKLRILRTPKISYLLGVSSVKSYINQVSAGTYKQNITTTMILVILPSFIE